MFVMSDVNAIIAPYKDAVGGTITALRAIVADKGYIEAADQHAVAELFNISHAEVRGIVSFYEDLVTEPPAETTIRVCQAEACQSVGCRELTKQLEADLGIKLGERTPDNRIALKAVYCLGLCSNGPAVMVGDKLIAGANDALVREARDG